MRCQVKWRQHNQCTNHFSVQNILHLCFLVKRLWTLSLQIANRQIHRCRYGLHVSKIKTIEDGVNVQGLRESEHAVVEAIDLVVWVNLGQQVVPTWLV
jgi:hypothetical protein